MKPAINSVWRLKGGKELARVVGFDEVCICGGKHALQHSPHGAGSVEIVRCERVVKRGRGRTWFAGLDEFLRRMEPA